MEEDQLIQELNSLLRSKISLDDEFVSHNALELFTRDTGLQSSIYSILTECVSRLKQQKSNLINDTIVSELQEVKEMLDQKSANLNHQEKNLRKKEQQFEKDKRAWVRKMDDEY